MIELSVSQARRFVVNRQGLHKKNAFGRGTESLLRCIERLGYVQIDTISVINRAHQHTLWSRIPSFSESQLDSLQRDGKIFEYWSHAASYLPTCDYRFSLPRKNAIADGQPHGRMPDMRVVKAVLERIRRDGAMKARDFENVSSDGKASRFWGSNKPAKNALEQLFMEGQLMISYRDGFQKVFDIPERVLPSGIDTSFPTTAELCRYLINTAIHSQGFVTVSEIGYLRKGIKPQLKNQLQQMLNDNELVEVRVYGNPNIYYSRPEIIEQASASRVAKKVHLLSPFDNLVIQRKRILDLFEFDYQIECYVPANKRKHGYFCLPILYGDNLVGRLDPKADRKNRKFIIRNLVIEKTLQDIEAFSSELARKIVDLSNFNGCESISIERCNIKKIGSAVSRLLADLP